MSMFPYHIKRGNHTLSTGTPNHTPWRPATISNMINAVEINSSDVSIKGTWSKCLGNMSSNKTVKHVKSQIRKWNKFVIFNC